MAMLGVVVGALAFGLTALAYVTFPDLVRRRSTNALVVAVLGPALVATFAAPAPTGVGPWDAALLAASTVVVGAIASAADRRVVLLAAVMVTTAAGLGGRGVLVASTAAGVATAVVALGVRLPAPKSLAGSLVALALLETRWPNGAGGRSVLAAVVVLALTSSAALATTAHLRRRIAFALAVMAGVTMAFTAAASVQALRARSHLEDAVAEARSGLASARTGDVDVAATRLASAQDRFDTAQRQVRGWMSQPAKLIPLVAQNQRALEAIAAAGAELARASAEVSSGFDLDTLRLMGGRLDLVEVAAVRRKLAGVAGIVEVSTHALFDADAPQLVPPVKDALHRFTTELLDAQASASLTLDVLRSLPNLLGRGAPRRYFLGVLGASEARAAGGIIGSHGILVASDGKLTLGELQHTSDLNFTGDVTDRTISGPEDYLARYATFEPERTWQNVTMSPDGRSVGQVVAELYPQSGGDPVDGVILVDHVALAALLKLTGPVSVAEWPEPLTAENVGRILLHDQYVRFPKAERVDFLGTTAHAVFDRITGSELPGPHRLAAALGPPAAGRHIVLYSASPREQALFERLRVDGALRPGAGDFLSVVSQNASGNKIDWFLRRTIHDDVQVSPEGETTATVTIRLDNAAPDVGEPDVVIRGIGSDPSPTGANRTFLSVYSPLEVQSATVNGKPVRARTDREGGTLVHDIFLTVPSKSSATVVFLLRGELPNDDGYVLDIRPQPLPYTDDVHVDIHVAGREPVSERVQTDVDRRIVVR